MNEAKIAQYLYISSIDYFFLFFFLNTYIKMFQIKALQISRERATQVYVSGFDINVKYHFHAGSWQPFNANKCLETSVNAEGLQNPRKIRRRRQTRESKCVFERSADALAPVSI